MGQWEERQTDRVGSSRHQVTPTPPTPVAPPVYFGGERTHPPRLQCEPYLVPSWPIVTQAGAPDVFSCDNPPKDDDDFPEEGPPRPASLKRTYRVIVDANSEPVSQRGLRPRFRQDPGCE